MYLAAIARHHADRDASGPMLGALAAQGKDSSIKDTYRRLTRGQQPES